MGTKIFIRRYWLSIIIYLLIGAAGLLFFYRPFRTPAGTTSRLNTTVLLMQQNKIVVDSNGEFLLPTIHGLLQTNSSLKTIASVSSPVNGSNNTPFCMTADDRIISMPQIKVLAMYTTGGKLVWRFVGEDVYWFRAVQSAAGYVLATDESERLHCLNMHGKQLWMYDNGGQIFQKCGTGEEYYKLAVNRQGQSVFALRSNSISDISAVDENGNLMWELNADHGFYTLLSRGLIGESIYVSFWDYESETEYTQALDWNGEEIWRCDGMSASNRDDLAVNSDGISLAGREGLYMLDGEGRIRWKNETHRFQSAAYKLPDENYATMQLNEDGSHELQILDNLGRKLKSEIMPYYPACPLAVTPDGHVIVAFRRGAVSIDPEKL